MRAAFSVVISLKDDTLRVFFSPISIHPLYLIHSHDRKTLTEYPPGIVAHV